MPLAFRTCFLLSLLLPVFARDRQLAVSCFLHSRCWSQVRSAGTNNMGWVWVWVRLSVRMEWSVITHIEGFGGGIRHHCTNIDSRMNDRAFFCMITDTSLSGKKGDVFSIPCFSIFRCTLGSRVLFGWLNLSTWRDNRFLLFFSFFWCAGKSKHVANFEGKKRGLKRK